jgi:branched-chain amino acid transport system substrate-binding protein
MGWITLQSTCSPSAPAFTRFAARSVPRQSFASPADVPTDDKLFGKGSIREDGRKIHDICLFEVKKPEENKGPWDYYKTRTTIPAAEAFRPMAEGECPLVKK